MNNLKCQICGRTHKEIMERNIGFYCNSRGDKFCLTCKEINERKDTGLISTLKESQVYKSKYQKLKNYVEYCKDDAPFIFKKLQELEKEESNVKN